jgi:hypothetical protein
MVREIHDYRRRCDRCGAGGRGWIVTSPTAGRSCSFFCLACVARVGRDFVVLAPIDVASPDGPGSGREAALRGVY